MISSILAEMKIFSLTFIFTLAIIFFLRPEKVSAQEKQMPQIGIETTYVSIEGLWKSTPETALHFGSTTLNASIKIDRILPDMWDVRGAFLENDEFRDYWQLSEFQYNENNDTISFTDSDGSIYIGSVDRNKQKITGIMYSGEPGNLVPEDQLDFIRATNVDPDRLFTPRHPEKDGSVQYNYFMPAAMNEEFLSESIFQHINDSTLLFNLIKNIITQKFGRLESFLIAKNNKLVLEEYFFNFDKTQIHNTFSCTKSVVSLLCGIALSEHGKLDVDQSVFTFFPNLSELKTKENEKIKLKDVLTMTAGLHPLGEDYTIESQELLMRDILSQPQDTFPGSAFRYNIECPYLLGGIIFNLTGKQVEEYAREKLFEPLKINHYKWINENGVTDCQSNLFLMPRDMMKIGLMVLNNGKWQGKQIVPENWIRESTKYRVAESEFFNYGYQWWHRSAENNSWWEKSTTTEEHHMNIALGFGGQYIFIVSDLNLVMVITSSDYNEANGLAFEKIPMVIEHIIPLFEN